VKVREKLILETISNHVKNKKVIETSHQGFSKGKPCLTDLIAFYNEMTGWVNEGRAVDIAYLDFRKAFGSVSCMILTEKLVKHGLGEQAVRWTENWLSI